TFHFPMEPGAPVTLRAPRALGVEEWHSLRCERRGNVLSLRLDEGVGTDSQTFEIPDGVEVDITSDRPILVGGQDTGQGADQFYGTVDNVSIEIFPAR
ncbi:MAG TPA: LamG domain-containing protein, partial [Kofleriaceae bacterium]|nr:LamG domain-containing protein [Kofleriaceae bacterium]